MIVVRDKVFPWRCGASKVAKLASRNVKERAATSFAAALMLAALLLSTPFDAAAHKGGTASITLDLDQAGLQLTLRSTTHALAPALNVAKGVNPIPELYRVKRETVLAYVQGYLTVRSGGTHPCKVSGRRLLLQGRRNVVLKYDYRCPRRVEQLRLRYDLLFDLDASHRAIVSVHDGPRSSSHVLNARRRDLRLERDVSPWDNAGDFLVLGVEHIFTGYDHLAFLIGLLLVVGVRGDRWPQSLGYLLKIVTSFTVAHSVTLVTSALGWISVPSSVVEPAIAASIAYVGLENLLARQPRYRWLLTFAFGLVHGFGFAYVLQEIGLPRNGLVLSLAAFNLGVELGQVGVVALLFPVVRLLCRQPLRWSAVAQSYLLLVILLGLLHLAGAPVLRQSPAYLLLLAACALGAHRLGYRLAVLKGGSALLALLGLFWLAQRLAGASWLGGVLG